MKTRPSPSHCQHCSAGRFGISFNNCVQGPLLRHRRNAGRPYFCPFVCSFHVPFISRHLPFFLASFFRCPFFSIAYVASNIYIYIYICVCVCVYIYIYVDTHTHTHYSFISPVCFNSPIRQEYFVQQNKMAYGRFAPIKS